MSPGFGNSDHPTDGPDARGLGGFDLNHSYEAPAMRMDQTTDVDGGVSGRTLFGGQAHGAEAGGYMPNGMPTDSDMV